MEKVKTLSGDKLFSHEELAVQGEVSLVQKGLLAKSEMSEMVHDLQVTNTSLHGTSHEEALDTTKLSLDRSESHVMRLTASLSGSAGNGGILARFQRFSGF